MRNSTPRKHRIPNQVQRGQVAVYLCAIALGVAVAYLVLNSGPFRTPSSGIEEDFGPAGGTVRAQLLGAKGLQRGARQQRQQQQEEGAADWTVPHDPEEDAWYRKLDAEGCKATENLRVCSHRAKSAEITDVFPGSLSAYAALWKAKVK